jgi:hypothetical protein
MRNIVLILAALILSACASPNRLVYSSGFSFGNYDYVIIGKPDEGFNSTSLYGLDVEVANLLSKYGMNVIGDKEFTNLELDNQKRTLIARMAVAAGNKIIILTVSFDDAATGRTGSSVTGGAKGNVFDGDDRGKAFEAVSKMLINALQNDKGLQITDEKKWFR